MTYNFNEELKKNEKEMNIGNTGESYYYNLEEGNNNVVRILTPGAVYGQHFFGKGVKPVVCYGKDKGCPIRDKDDKFEHADVSVKYCLFVVDRVDNEIKTAYFPYSVMKQLGALQDNPDYKFDDLPMPYDVRITYKKDESPANKYKVDVKPGAADLTEKQKEDLQKKLKERTPEQIVERMKEKQLKLDTESGKKMTPEMLQKESEGRLEDLHQLRQKAEQEHPVEMPAVEYPDAEAEGINPEDIPF